MQYQNKPFSISVVLPTFNRINRIKKCLPSFLKTEVKDVQFIIIDNNSNDGTWNYLKSVAINDARVKIYKNPQNIGPIKTIFRGYCEVKSPYAIFLSDDDFMIGDYIAKCLEIFSKHDDVSIIHHSVDKWQKAEKRYQVSYTLYSKGYEAIANMFALSGAYTGLSFRMSCFNLSNFPLEKNVLYPQVKIGIDMTRKYNMAMIHNCGMIAVDFGDTVESVKKKQNRPDSMGINERLSYALELKDKFLIQTIAFKLADWGIRLFQKIEKENVKQSRQFAKSLFFTLNNVTPYFIICLFKIKKYNLALYSLISLIYKPSFFINYIWFIIFAFKKFYLKRKKKN
ncbi:MAG: hypothetical protein CBC16_01725 [Verrucomicrobia bacterium TMED56]|nr:MAG: hypothetical protein CBC16_01725 [Verrucomicrobia bacterium TMED56]